MSFERFDGLQNHLGETFHRADRQNGWIDDLGSIFTETWDVMCTHIPARDPLCLTMLLPGELVLAFPREEDSVQELARPTDLEWIPGHPAEQTP